VQDDPERKKDAAKQARTDEDADFNFFYEDLKGPVKKR